MSATGFAGVSLVGAAGDFCDDAHAHAADVAAFMKDRVAKIDGGERVLGKTVERIEPCAARRRAEEPHAQISSASRPGECAGRPRTWWIASCPTPA